MGEDDVGGGDGEGNGVEDADEDDEDGGAVAGWVGVCVWVGGVWCGAGEVDEEEKHAIL